MHTSNTAERLKLLLDENRITQTELAKRTGLSKATVNQYVRGDNLPRQKNLTKLAKALHTTETYLMGYDDDREIVDIRKENVHANNLNAAIGQAMKQLRLSKHVSIDEMAEKLGRKKECLENFENNKTQIVAITIARYCKHLDYDVRMMLEDIAFIFDELENEK